MIPSTCIVGTAKGYSGELYVGTVVLALTCDNGTKHTFIIKDVIYMEDSPVNSISTRRLAKLFSDENSNPDRHDTGITSPFNTLVLFWNHNKFKKTFSVATSGLPECLFNTGYSNYVSYVSKVSNYYDDSMSWSFASEVEEGTVSEGGVVDLTVERTISHIEGITLIYNDRSKSKSLVTYIDVDFVVGMQQKCRIRKSDGVEIYVYPDTLYLIQNPDITSIPETSDDYCIDCSNISPKDLKEILSSKLLSPLQEEITSYHV